MCSGFRLLSPRAFLLDICITLCLTKRLTGGNPSLQSLTRERAVHLVPLQMTQSLVTRARKGARCRGRAE